MYKLALLSSSGGFIISAIVKYFENKDVKIVCLSDDEHSDVLKKADEAGIDFKYLPSEKNFEYFSSNYFNLVALFNYKSRLDADVLKTTKFVNLHEALLPSFKGDDALWRAFNSGVKVSGVTIHRLSDDVQGSGIIAQYPVLIGNLTHFDEFKEEMQNVEKLLYPVVIDKLLKDEVFDFSDFFKSGNCGQSCGGCGKCN